jgi:hypothetical protein
MINRYNPHRRRLSRRILLRPRLAISAGFSGSADRSGDHRRRLS